MTFDIKDKIFQILPLVSKPSRYIGSEINAVVKDKESVRLNWALCFPDAYEVGMSHIGIKILYEILNSRPEIWAQRAFAPWRDMEEKLRAHNLPLYALEGFTPLAEMDVVAFTLQYELSYSNVLNMLDLAGIPLYAKDRGPSHPLVIAGGPCALSPEPLADFIDAFDTGDSEESVLEISDVLLDFKKKGVNDRAVLLDALSKIEGVYVPAHFEVSRCPDGKIKAIKNIAGGADKIKRRVVQDIDSAPFPVRPPVPYMAAVHNRVQLEISRGCPRGCRFCQAGYVYRPARERSPERLMTLAESAVSSTGYDEISLSSLSAGDYSCLLSLVKGLMDTYGQRRISVSLPSLRVGTLTPEICREIGRVRKTGFTIAPEAGTQRLRDVINKNITEDALMETASAVFSSGWNLIKLYFMVGLPTETDEDLRGIIDLSRKVLNTGRNARGQSVGGARPAHRPGSAGVNVGVSVFVPKAHTPFQRMGQIPVAEMRRKKEILGGALGRKPFAMKTGLAEMSALESAFARGGRELGAALHNAWKKGARFDGWTEEFKWQTWRDAFHDAGLDVEAEAARGFAPDEILPWSHIDCGVTDRFFKKEMEKALRGEASPGCLEKCLACGLGCKDGKDSPLSLPLSPPAVGGIKGGGLVENSAKSLPARLRIKYSKLMPLAMLSHTEMMTLFFRAISRAGLPVAFSEGFNPHPKFSFGPALAVGIESEAEILDMELSYAIDLKTAANALNLVLPSGVRVFEARYLSPKEAPAGVGITQFEYEAEVPAGADAVATIEAFLAKDSAVVSRISDKGTKEIDVRAMVQNLRIKDNGRTLSPGPSPSSGRGLGEDELKGGKTVVFTLSESGGKSAKPFEAVQAIFGLSREESRAARIKRLRMY